MAETDEQVKMLEVRTKWPNEALDFTPWLADNLHLLGEELGMKLELVQQEKSVGPMSLDILAKDTVTGDLVAIENQLEWTDTHHLGQMLTYATGCDACVAIWVATEFRHEYATALHKLNEWTSDRNRFYGVKIELVRKPGSSHSEPRFRKVVYPGGWEMDNTLPVRPTAVTVGPEVLGLLSASDRESGPGGVCQPTPFSTYGHPGRFFRPSLQPDTGYAVSLESGNSDWVSLHIQTGERRKDQIGSFDELHDFQRKDIESKYQCRPLSRLADG